MHPSVPAPAREPEFSVPDRAGIALLQDLTNWRENLARSIARNNLSMHSEQITEAVNRILFSLLFLRIAEDRGLAETGTLSDLSGLWIDHQKNDCLFQVSEALYFEDSAAPKNSSFLLNRIVLGERVLFPILEKIASPYRDYDLSCMPLEVIARVLSHYLSRTIRRSATHQAIIVDTNDMQIAGGFTPIHPAGIDYMVHEAIITVRRNRTGNEILPVRIVDPACGAGAILLSAFHYLLDDSFQSTRDFEERTAILTGSVYGVDINRHAVAATRMLLMFRLFENIPPDLVPHDFVKTYQAALGELYPTVRCGNALIGPDITGDESWMFCPIRDRRKINMFDWKHNFSEIFDSGGFDAVIGNPPDGPIEPREWIQQYFQRHYAVYHPMADRSAYFLEKGLGLVCNGGVVSFLMNDRWMRGKSGAPLRKIIGARQIEEIVDFSEEGVRGIAGSPCILRITKRPPLHPFYAIRAGTSFKEDPFRFAQVHRFPVDQLLLREGGWIIKDTRMENILARVRRRGISLEDLVMGEVHPGVSTGYDSAFVIDRTLAREWIRKDPRCKTLVRPFVTGSDMSRYTPWNPMKYIIFIPQGWTNAHPGAKKRPWQWLRKRHPFIVHYLKPFAEEGKTRKEQGDYWWEIACNEDFWREKHHKTFFPARFDIPVFFYDNGLSIADPSAFAIPSSSRYLSGILNSRLTLALFNNAVQAAGTEEKMHSWEELKGLPVYIPDFDCPEDKAGHDRIVALVAGMSEMHRHLSLAKTDNEKRLVMQEITSTERQIDSLVYGFYGLTKDEIAVIEESVVNSRSGTT